MSCLKKILSILLSVLLLISLCTFYPSVQASDSSVSKEVSGLLSALEIVPEGYNYQLNGSMKVTRQEFISLVMKALKVENSVADHTYFSDVDVNGNNTHYINCAVDMGIIKGYGDGTFHPDDLISINDCLKIAVEACGYGVIAQQSGGYPIGYLTVAADTKISKNLTGDYRRYAVMEDARFIIYNMLHAERVNIYTADGMVNGTTDSGKSILSDIYNVYRSSGIVTGTQFTRLTSDSKLKEGYIEIGGELFLQNKTDYSKFLGYNVSFYYMIEEEVKVLVYVSPSSYNHDIMYKAQDIANYSNRQYTFYDGTKKHYEKVPLTADVIYNGQVLLGDYDESVLKPDNGSVTMIDNNEDGIYDVIKVINKRIIVVDSVDVNEGIIYDRLTTNGFPLQTQYKNNRITLTNQLGTAIELTDVKRDGVVEAEISIDGTLANIVVHESSVNGILSGTVQEENEILYKVDDIAYPINNYLALYIKNKGLKFSFGSRYKFLLTTDGEIAWLIAEAEAEGNYGCLIKAATDNTMNNILNLKILTTEDRIGIFECADKIKINEQPRMKSKEALGFLKSLLVDSSTGEAVPLVIYYKMDDENKINYIETPNASSTTTNESLRISGTAMNITTTKGNVSSVGGSVNFDKDTVMFMIPEDLENTQDKNLRAVKINEYARDATVFKLIVGYSREPDAVISRVILNRETAGDSYDWSIFMVTDVLKGLTEKEEEKYILKGLLKDETYKN